MRFAHPRLLAAATTLVLPAAALAAGGGEEGGANPVEFNLAPAISTLVVFGLSFGILAKFVWPKLVAGLEEREKKIRDEISSAEEARERADQALKDYERSLAEARAEADRMIEQTKAEQARLAADLKTRAEEEVGQMRQSALQNIEAAKRAALDEIYAETATLATRVAAKILEREISEDDQRRLVDETVSEYTRTSPLEPV